MAGRVHHVQYDIAGAQTVAVPDRMYRESHIDPGMQEYSAAEELARAGPAER